MEPRSCGGSYNQRFRNHHNLFLFFVSDFDQYFADVFAGCHVSEGLFGLFCAVNCSLDWFDDSVLNAFAQKSGHFFHE